MKDTIVGLLPLNSIVNHRDGILGHNNFNTDKVCNSANAPLMGFVHMYMHCYLVTRDIFITSRSTRSLRWKLCSKTCFDAVGESRLDQEIQSELRLVF